MCKSGITGNCESSRSLFLHASEHVLTPQRFTAPESTVPFGTGCASLLPKLQRVIAACLERRLERYPRATRGGGVLSVTTQFAPRVRDCADTGSFRVRRDPGPEFLPKWINHWHWSRRPRANVWHRNFIWLTLEYALLISSKDVSSCAAVLDHRQATCPAVSQILVLSLTVPLAALFYLCTQHLLTSSFAL